MNQLGSWSTNKVVILPPFFLGGGHNLATYGCFQNRAAPKWMVYNEKPDLTWMIWGGNPLFAETSIFKNDMRNHHLEKKHRYHSCHTSFHQGEFIYLGVLPCQFADFIRVRTPGGWKSTKSEIPTADMELHRDPNQQEEMFQIKSTKYLKKQPNARKYQQIYRFLNRISNV